ncbi:MAG: TatD family hydrolase [Candidatus Bipolaricaulota bacterium]|nr:TatD family hydrolase [Candidatus Bipolaricaulota bacterium]
MVEHIELIDTHVHLDLPEFESDRQVVITRCFTAGIGAITVGIDLGTSKEAVGLAGEHRHLWAAVGVHPHEAKTVDGAIIAQLKRLAQKERVVAIGEIGLDYYRDLSPRRTQRAVFRGQIELARGLNLPIIVHNRESTDELVGILEELKPPYRGVMHSFLGDAGLALKFLSMGFYLGIGGPLTFKRNASLRGVVQGLPLDRLLVETDSPYLTPVPHRGKRNEPAYVRHVAEKLAEIKGVPLEEIAAQTTKNAIELFGL